MVLLNELKRRFPNCSPAFLKANLDVPDSEPESSQHQPAVRHEPLAETSGEEENPVRVHVCVTSVRRRLIDPDNLCAKYFIDCLRYAGFIKDDSAEHITLSVRQSKAATKAAEKTVIEIRAI